MSYQVLARKWRPRTFHELVGQEHVSRALVNALDQGRLHHAYLFTGTRGVGKTTLARILAKCLNCEQGVTSTPCGQCDTCRTIDEGRFVDLIEVDAASRTRVEDTRELLENVQYAPTQGRYKVYLVDEVHMLSTHSFNALLKTLEEPPPHVKFLLATTDPQKLPVTVLSRCLQFALKQMTPERIVEHLDRVLNSEQVEHEERALWLLGRAANGSMRDALSLTDQAIAFGEGRLDHADVAAMLGTLDHQHVISLAEGLAAADAPALLDTVARLAEQGPDFADILDSLCSIFHRLAIAQMVPQALDNAQGDREVLLTLAGRFTAEDVQLYYQMALNGRRDMEQAPEPRSALEMVLLRMLAFRPQGVPRPADTPLPMRGSDGGDGSSAAGPPDAASSDAASPAAASSNPEASAGSCASGGHEPDSASPTEAPAPGASVEGSAAESAGAAPDEMATASDTSDMAEAAEELPQEWQEFEQSLSGDASPALPDEAFQAGSTDSEGDDEDDSGADATAAMQLPPDAWASADSDDAPAAEETDEEAPSRESEVAAEPLAPAEPAAFGASDFHAPVEADHHRLTAAGWLALFPQLSLSGMTRNLIAHCVVEQDDGHHLTLRLDPSQGAMNAEIHQQRLVAALEAAGYARHVTLQVGELDADMETPKARSDRLSAERRERAVEALRNDPHIRELEQLFDARLLDNSVRSFEAE
ncbi:DNA polymerase III gamma subunit /DNA polymerase III tau subunit [Kushneria sinocarnis]|uniref:DNA polymerase III subunit gamma/tau n=1 Tax=Kushneria sinocarnis TaxID=595502 RepID=A0A420WTX9_9GAMM|nr:DNA polymerase III subunit gamma/tau [Kushneria sinocarnis]RKQ96387.1 DNA polymerase III gamma subunit /DNA polymerase III tau subunit [Kushneria sinocarnis]